MPRKKEQKTAEPEEDLVEVDPETGNPPEPTEASRTSPVPQDEIEVEVEEEESEEEEVEEKPKSSGDGNTMAAFEALIKKIEGINLGSQQQIQLPQREAEESEEDFAKRFNEEVFKEDPHGNVSKLVDRKTRKILEEQVAPILGSIMEDAFENQVFRYKNDTEEGDIYRHLEPEIQKILKTLPPAQQKNPQILKRVYDKVKADHVDEIVDIKIAARDKSKASSAGVHKKAPVTEGGSSMVPGNQRRTVRIPASELEQLKAQSLRQGVELSVLLERRKAR